MTAFTVENLIRHLERLQARGPIPFDVKSGEIFGILCPPCGQDRQTLLSLLMTILFPVPGFAERSPLAVLATSETCVDAWASSFPSRCSTLR